MKTSSNSNKVSIEQILKNVISHHQKMPSTKSLERSFKHMIGILRQQLFELNVKIIERNQNVY